MVYDALEAIAQANVAVLLPDTCILLDMLRSPRRNTVDEAAILASRAIQGAVHQSGAVGCVVAEQVRLELNENLPKVRNDTNTAIRNLTDELNRIDKWSEALGQDSQTDISHFMAGVPVAEALMLDIVSSSLTHLTTPDITNRAFTRLMQHRTPAKLGKDSTKDCVVVESYLEVAQDLRNLGHSGDIVFASSNTSEYISGSSRILNADIKAEFDALGIKYSRALH